MPPPAKCLPDMQSLPLMSPFLVVSADEPSLRLAASVTLSCECPTAVTVNGEAREAFYR